MTQAIIIHNLLWCEFIFAWIRTKQVWFERESFISNKARLQYDNNRHPSITAGFGTFMNRIFDQSYWLKKPLSLCRPYRHNEKYIMHHKLLINYTVNPFVIVITRASIIRALKHYELLFYHNVYMYCNICRALFISKLYYWNWLNKRY